MNLNSNVRVAYSNTGDTIYPITFEYDRRSDVQVRALREGTANEYDVVTNWEFDGATFIKFTGEVPDNFEILRVVDISRPWGESKFSQFQSQSAIKAVDLNGNLELLRQAIEANILPEEPLYDVDLDTTLAADSVTITNTGGTDATIPAVDSSNAGVMTPEMLAKLNAPPPDPGLSSVNLASVPTENDVTITNDAGDNATIAAASSSQAGVMTSTMYDQLQAAAADSTNITVTENATTVSINSSTGSGDNIEAVTDTLAGVMTPTQKITLDNLEDRLKDGFVKQIIAGNNITLNDGSDGTGTVTINAETSTLNFVGDVDVTSDTIPVDAREAAKQDLYLNTGTGKFSAVWAAVTSNADETTDALPGDYMVYNGTDWKHIPVGQAPSGQSFWQRSVTAGQPGKVTPINAGDYVGVGTADPKEWFQVSGAAIFANVGTEATGSCISGFGLNLQSGNNASDVSQPSIALAADSTSRYATINCDRGSDNTKVGLSFSTSDNAAPATRVTIAPNGNVGVGTTEPRLQFVVGNDNNPNVESTIVWDDQRGYSHQAFCRDRANNADKDDPALLDPQFGVYDYTNSRTWLRYKFADPTNSQTADDTRLCILESGGRVGIGTTGPNEKLTVAGGIISVTNAGRAVIRLYNQDAKAEWEVGQQSKDDSNFYIQKKIADDYTPCLAIDRGTHYVGIGTTAPKQILDVKGSIFAGYPDWSSDQDVAYLIAGTAGWTGATDSWNTFGFQHKIKTTSAGVPRVTIDTQNGEAWCVNSEKRVGIGETEPKTKLDILGPANDTIVPDNAIFRFKGSGNNGLYMGTLSASPYQSYIQSGFFGNNNNDNVYSLLLNPAGGSVGIGCSKVNEKLQVSGAGIFTNVSRNTDFGVPLNGYGLNLISFNNTNANSVPTIALASDRSDRYASINTVRFANSSQIGLSFSTSNDTAGVGTRMIISSNGKVGIGTGSTADPVAQLEVKMADSSTDPYFKGGGTRGLRIHDETRTSFDGDCTVFYKATAAGRYVFAGSDTVNRPAMGDLGAGELLTVDSVGAVTARAYRIDQLPVLPAA